MTETDKDIAILASALEAYENGKDIPEILALYPEHKESIKEIFKTIVAITEKNEAPPAPRDGLLKILSALPEPIFVGEPASTGSRQNSPLRGKLMSLDTLGAFNFMSWKIAAPVVVLALIIGGGIWFWPQATTTPEGTGILAASDADTTTDALFSTSEAEMALLTDSSQDIDLVNSDADIINGFAENYEAQF